MEKVIGPGSWDFGETVSQMVKVSSRGLQGADYGVLVKRAGEEFAHRVRNIKIAANQIPVHTIAIGATEGYGPNRNGDGFKEATLKSYHDTFVKYARHYRHHQNKDPDKSYGKVVFSCYNEPMKRVELLHLLNGDEKAAADNGGLVADKELELLNSGKDLPVSMACTVDYDVCSGCQNKARTRDEYCDEKNCKYGGCKNNLTKVAEDGHILHVDNPHPKYFDISTVLRPADRIAYGGVANYLQKAASGDVLGGAALAAAWGVMAPLDLVLEHVQSPRTRHQVKLAYQLAALEDLLNVQQTQQDRDLARAFSPTVQAPLDLEPLGKLGSYKFATGLAALARQKVAMPITDFLRLVLGDSTEKFAELSASVPGLLPGVYNRLITGGSLERDIVSNAFSPSQDLPPATQREWAQKQAESHSLHPLAVQKRVMLSAIRSIVPATMLQRAETKQASASGEAETLARRYALYKLAFLAEQTSDVLLTANMLVRQNYA